MKQLLPTPWRVFSPAALACLRTGLFIVSFLLLVAAPGFAQDVLWGLTSNGGPEGAGTAFSVSSTGADFTVRKAFASKPTDPYGNVVLGRDGNFYGLSQYGGRYDQGTVFKVSPTGRITVLRSLEYGDGINPMGGLVQGRDGDFYGMTSQGGSNGAGTIFKISSTGTFTLLKDFNYTDGAGPWGNLVEGRDGDFYGMTFTGGSTGAGTIFKISPTGTHTILKHFVYVGGGPWISVLDSDGGFPYGGLVQGRDGDFYGMTSAGGTSDQGTVFKISPAGTYTLLKSFDYSDGWYPFGSLVEGRDGDFYGMTSYGGSNGYGTIFKITPAGTHTVLRHLDLNDGVTPSGSLVQGPDGDFYGLAQQGGINYGGTVFKISSTGTFSLLKSFNSSEESLSYAFGSLVPGPDGDFYGMRRVGNFFDGYGVLFKVSATGTFTPLIGSDHANGANPYGSLVKGRDGYFYGMTKQGGSNERGTIFKISPTGTHTVLKSLDNATGTYPTGSLVEGSDGNFYGMTESGGGNGYGTLFRISPAGTLTVLKNFNGSDGAYPQGSLLEGRDGYFYGVTQQGGSSGNGTVFKISPAGTFAVLKNFNGSDGSYPSGALVEGRDGDFYGVTQYGGLDGQGTVFKISYAGVHTMLKEFAGFDDGSYPSGALVQGHDGDFYGTTSSGGFYYTGTVFKISPDGTHRVLDFNVFIPRGGLVEGSDGSFYGMTRGGGTDNQGTIFKISPDGTRTIVRSFTAADGNDPFGSLVIDKPACTPPVLAAVPADTTVNAGSTECGASVSFEASATGAPAPGITYKAGDDVITSPHVFPVGTTTVTAIAANSCGTVTKSFAVTVVDKTAPVPQVAALPDLTGECAVKIAAAPQADDNCGGVVTATTTDPLEYTAQGTYTVTWNYRDESGNTTTQTQKVVVKDRTAPVPVVATLPEATGDCSVTVTAPQATDNCQGSITATTTDPTTYTAQGTFVIHWRYDDGRGNVTEQPQTVRVKDVTSPAITAPAALTLTNAPGQCGLSLADVSLGVPLTFDNCAGLKAPTHDAPAFLPVGTTTLTWTVEDAAGNASTATQRVTIANADPVVGTIAAPLSPVGINTPVTASADFTDNNLTEATWDWGNGTSRGTIDAANGKITGSRSYTTPGVHTVTLTLTDACGKTAVSTFRYVVVYDPNGGFVTGGGWINSPANAYAPNPSATGTARFGFVSKYQKGASQPVGTTNFEFEAAGLSFHSTAYEWLVVAGGQAQYKGAGTLNGASGYTFLLTAVDGQVNGGTGTDRLRIKIWKAGQTVPVYDNQRGAADDAAATTTLGGGSIMVHEERSKARQSVEASAEAPLAAPTLSGFPNPFTGKTTIAFTLGRQEEYTLAVYDLKGRLVARLGTGKAAAGETNRVVWEARTAPSGVYFVRLTTRSGVQHLKLVLR